MPRLHSGRWRCGTTPPRALDNHSDDFELIALAPGGEAFQIRPRRLRLVQLQRKLVPMVEAATRAGASRIGIGAVDITMR